MKMPNKRSKSKERERKRLQRSTLTEEKKKEIREKDAKAKKDTRQGETQQERQDRLNSMTNYSERQKADQNETHLVEKRKKLKRLNTDIGVVDGKATCWIKKSLKEMSSEERKEYFAHMKRKSRNFHTEEKKEYEKKQDRKEKYRKRFARFRHFTTEDLRDSEESKDENMTEMLERYLKWESTNEKRYPFELTSDEQEALKRMKFDREIDDEQNSEDEEPYWMDYEDEDNERDGVLQCGNLSPGELEEEANAINEHLKFLKKKKYNKPMDQLPEKELSPYEIIRGNIIKERVEAMENSGLFPDIDQLKDRIFKEKMIV